MDYMLNGCLRDYLLAHNDEILETQRLRWIQEAAEGLQLLHSAGVFHCDIAPKNFLLDADLSLKIADFGSSSLDDSRPSGCASTRFITPNFTFSTLPTVQEDLYALGSTMYNIMTGKAPYQELESDEVERRYRAHDFPDITDVPCGKIIQCCWRSDVVSAQEVCDFVEGYINKETLQG
jgi:serine/threonine protein kinase